MACSTSMKASGFDQCEAGPAHFEPRIAGITYTSGTTAALDLSRSRWTAK